MRRDTKKRHTSFPKWMNDENQARYNQFMDVSTLSVMTYNLRFASDARPHSWQERLPVALEMIHNQEPDIIGTQEGFYPQLCDLERGLPDYRWIGLGRDGGSAGEFMAVFYRKERLKPLSYHHYWLSDTPTSMGSSTWGNSNRRMVTEVVFLDQETSKTFQFWNTHFDFADPFHSKAANLVLTRLRSLSGSEPIILVGDFNAPAEDTNTATGASDTEGNTAPYNLYRKMTSSDAFRDAYKEAPEKLGPQGIASFHGYEGEMAGERIDWILLHGMVHSQSTSIVTFRAPNGQYPSDHFPITVKLTF